MSDLDNMQLENFQKELETAKTELKILEDSSKTEPTELTKTEESIEKVNTLDEQSQPERTEQELEAIKQGWNPDHKGVNKKSAEQFLHDGSFFKKIDSQNKKIEGLTDTVKALIDHNKKLEEVKFKEGYKKALEERNIAIEEGNIQAFNVAEEKLKQNIEAQQSLQKISPEPPIPTETLDLLHKFKDTNKTWFAVQNDSESKEMTDLAIAYDTYNLGKGKSQEASLKEVESLIKLKFPHRFENKEQERAPAVLKSTVSSSSTKSNGLEARLSEQQLWMFKQAKAIDSTMKIEEYAKQLKSIGALRDE